MSSFLSRYKTISELPIEVLQGLADEQPQAELPEVSKHYTVVVPATGKGKGTWKVKANDESKDSK